MIPSVSIVPGFGKGLEPRMNGDQIDGLARKTGGRLREVVGGAVGDDRMKAGGAADHAMGAIQHGYGQAKEGAKTLADGAPAFDEIIASARQVGRRIDETLRDQFGASAPTYVLAGAITFLGVAVLWAGRERD